MITKTVITLLGNSVSAGFMIFSSMPSLSLFCQDKADHH